MPFQVAVVARDELATAKRRLSTPEAEGEVTLRVPQLENVALELVVTGYQLVPGSTRKLLVRNELYHSGTYLAFGSLYSSYSPSSPVFTPSK